MDIQYTHSSTGEMEYVTLFVLSVAALICTCMQIHSNSWIPKKVMLTAERGGGQQNWHGVRTRKQRTPSAPYHKPESFPCFFTLVIRIAKDNLRCFREKL